MANPLETLTDIDWSDRRVQIASVGVGAVVFTVIVLNRRNQARTAEQEAALAAQAQVPVNYVAYGTSGAPGIIGYVGDESDPILPPGVDVNAVRRELLIRRAEELVSFLGILRENWQKATKRAQKTKIGTQYTGFQGELSEVVEDIAATGYTWEPPIGVMDPLGGGGGGGNAAKRRCASAKERVRTTLRELNDAIDNLNDHADDVGKPVYDEALARKQSRQRDYNEALEREKAACGNTASAGMGGEGPRPTSQRSALMLGRFNPPGALPHYRQYYGYGRVGAAPTTIPAPISGGGFAVIAPGESLAQLSRRVFGSELYWSNIAARNRLTRVPLAGTPLMV